MKGLWEMAKEKHTTNTAKSGAGDNGEAAAAQAITVQFPAGAPERPGYQAELIRAGEVSMAAGMTSAMHVNVNVGPRAAAAFVRVRNGLRAIGAKRPDGRPVWTNADAMRFIFEAIADAQEGHE